MAPKKKDSNKKGEENESLTRIAIVSAERYEVLWMAAACAAAKLAVPVLREALITC